MDPSSLRRQARQRGLSVFTDLGAAARAVREGRSPWAACRAAQYVVIDHAPLPLAGAAATAQALAAVDGVVGGVGFRARPPPRATLRLQPPAGPAPEPQVRVSVSVRPDAAGAP